MLFYVTHHCTALHCTEHRFTTLYCTSLYYWALHYGSMSLITVTKWKMDFGHYTLYTAHFTMFLNNVREKNVKHCIIWYWGFCKVIRRFTFFLICFVGGNLPVAMSADKQNYGLSPHHAKILMKPFRKTSFFSLHFSPKKQPITADLILQISFF